jgi:large subunit ribosomal protein L13
MNYLKVLTQVGVEMNTYSAIPGKVQHDWFVIDADHLPLGRLASEIAKRLRGKHKAEFTPHVDTGDYIIVVNAKKVRITGRKAEDKVYYRYSGYPGGLKTTPYKKLLGKMPERVIEMAVKGMLPRNPLGRKMYGKLKVYSGSTHPHTAQNPKVLSI